MSIIAADSCSESKAKYDKHYTYSYALLASALTRDEPPILKLAYVPGSGKTRDHWVVVWKVYEGGHVAGDYWINDPAKALLP